jgi:hypothetical protein
MRYILIPFIIACVGCTDIPLRQNTERQAGALGDVYEQEVMNNLAMFVHDSGSMPWFSYANQGGSSVTDQGNVGATAGWSRGSAGTAPFLFNSVGGSLGLQRAQQESFTMTPVNDPRRLELMRCAYQKVLISAGVAAVSGTCPDCQNRFNVFYTGDENGDINAKSKGVVTSECLNADVWFGWGPKKCVPKNCCTPVGCYCGTYVWVLPGQRDHLAKLTLMILDYALNPFPVPLTKTVVYYLDEQGLPTTQAQSVSTVAGNVAITERNESLLNLPPATETELRDRLQHQLFDLEQQIATLPAVNQRPPASREDLRRRNDLLAQRDRIEGQLRYLKIQLEVGGLKQEYTRNPAFSASFGTSTNAILSNQTLNTLTAPTTLTAP